MFKLKKKLEEEKRKSEESFPEDFDFDGLADEIVELVDIVEEPEKTDSFSEELSLSDELQADAESESPLDEVEFPTEIRNIAEEFDEEVILQNDDLESQGEPFAETLNNVPLYSGDRVIAESLGIAQDDSPPPSSDEKGVGTEEKTGADPESESIDKPDFGLTSPFSERDHDTNDKLSIYGMDTVDLEHELSPEPDNEDHTLVMDAFPDIQAIQEEPEESAQDEPILSLTEEVSDNKNEESEAPVLESKSTSEDFEPPMGELESETEGLDDKDVQKTQVDLSISQLVPTESLEVDLKEELKEDFFSEPNEPGIDEYEATVYQTEAPSEVSFEEMQPVSQEETLVDQAVVFSEVSAEKQKVSDEEYIETIIKTLRPQVHELVTQLVKEQLPKIVEEIIMGEIEKIKKYLREN